MTRVPSADKDDMVGRLRRDMARLLEAVDHVPPGFRRRPTSGGWMVKDVLAHIAAWDRELVRALDQLLAGELPKFTGYRENDFNAGVIAATQAIPFADIRREARSAHSALLKRLRNLSPRLWRRPSAHRWRGGRPITVASLFAYTYRGETHCAGHAAEIEAAGRGGPA